MPSHVYKPDPPLTWWKRVLVHPYENTISVFFIILGILLITQAVFVGSSPGMDLLPWWVTLIIGVASWVGGAVALIGLHWGECDEDDMIEGWALDRLGHYTQAGTLAGFGTAILFYYPESVPSWLVLYTLAGAAYLRVLAVGRMKRDGKKNWRAYEMYKRGADE
jgi:hypothetical protein